MVIKSHDRKQRLTSGSWTLLGGAAIVFFASAATSVGKPPALTYFYPAGVQRGSTAEVTASGTFERWPVKVFVGGDGLRVECQEKKGTFKITAEEQATPGVHWIRVHDAEGASTLRPFLVGLVPEALDKEPNNRLDEGQEIETPRTVNGKLEKSGDVDGFYVNAKAGQTLVASLVANRTLASPMDAVMQICSEAGFVLQQNDDGRGVDPQIVFQVPADGRYLVRIFAFPQTPNSTIGFAGAASYIYRLTITTGPFVDHVLPTSIGTGEETSIRLFGWNLPEPLTATELVPHEQGQRVAFHPNAAQSVALSPVDHKSLVADAANGPQDLQDLELPATVSGRIETQGDVDGFRLQAKKGEKLSFQIASDSLGFLLDPLLILQDSTGKVVAEVDDTSRKPDCVLAHTVPADGEYHLLVKDAFGSGSLQHVYRLTASRQEADFKLKLSADVFTMEAGKSVTVAVGVERLHGFKMPIKIQAADLPAGVTAEPVESAAEGDSAKSVNVILKATGDAALPVSGPFRIIGTADGKERTAVYTISPHQVERTDPWCLAQQPK